MTLDAPPAADVVTVAGASAETAAVEATTAAADVLVMRGPSKNAVKMRLATAGSVTPASMSDAGFVTAGSLFSAA